MPCRGVYELVDDTYTKEDTAVDAQLDQKLRKLGTPAFDPG